MLRVLCLTISLCLAGVSRDRVNAAGADLVRASATMAVDRYNAPSDKRLSRPLNPAACLRGSSEFVASWQGKKFLAPCRFINETIAHLRAVSELGASKRNFPLHTDHVHLAVPAELWQEKYHRYPQDQILTAVLWESRLVAVYHATDALILVHAKGASAESKRSQAYNNRQVLGYYDGRGIEILPNYANALAQQYRSVAWFYFLPRGLDELVAFSPDEAVTFDISFDHDLDTECSSSGGMESGNVRIDVDETDHAEDCGEPSYLREGGKPLVFLGGAGR